MALGDKIKQLRKTKKLSIRELASLAELSKTTINEIENNIVTNPTRGTLTNIAGALGVPVGLLLEEEAVLQDITEDLLLKAKFNGSLSDLPEDEKKNMLTDLLIQEPSAFYETAAAGGYIGPLSDDEMVALKAYLKIYRESKKG